MARAHALVVLAAIAAGTAAWVWLSLDQTEVPIDGATDAEERPTAAAPRARGEDARTELRGSGAETQAEQPAAIPTDAPVSPPEETDTASVELRVRDLAQKQPVAAFRWHFLPERGPATLGTGSDGAASLRLPPAAAGRLFVEADGLESLQQELRVPSATAPPLQVDLFLAPSATASGVVLTARDAQGAPVLRLRLDLWLLQPSAPRPPADADPEGEPLWKRTFESWAGVFQLTALAAGDYALRAQPVDADQVALPLQPCRHVFAFAGHEAVPLALDFRPGVVLSIAAETGAPLALRATVTSSAGVQSVLWRSRRGEDQAVVGRDLVELPGRATTLLALPPGDYAVALQHDGLPVALHPAASPADGVRAFTAVLPQ